MNYEDRFIPIQSDEDLYMDFDSRQKRIMDDYKLSNPRFHKINKVFYTKSSKKVVPIEFYSSGNIGNSITHAVSGTRQQGQIIGSSREDLFFKVSLCNNKISNEHITLFYYSPEEYEKHQLVTISDNIKSKWNEKFMKASIKFKLDE